MAYKVFTNGSPLPASDLNTYLMNQSVMVFADSTARSAALTSPIEGMVTYLENDNKLYVWTGSSWVDVNDNAAAIPKSTVTTAGDLIVADGSASVTRLGIGSNGQILTSNGTTATWTSPAGGGSQSWTQLASGSMPAASTLSLTSFTAKDKYLLFCYGVSSQNASAVYTGTVNSDTGTNYALMGARYSFGTPTANSAIATSVTGIANNANFVFAQSSGTDQLSSGVITLEITGAQSNQGKFINFSGHFTTQSENGEIDRFGTGIYRGTSAISSIEITTTGGNFDAGSYELWGSD